MSTLRSHLTKHWHWHLTGWGLSLAALLLALGGSTAVAIILHGGYRPRALPPRITIGGGHPVPASWSLARYVVRVHNQGNSNSCVGQTIATIREIVWAERHPHRPAVAFSSGYIYDQSNGGHDGGTTYDAAFGVLVRQGDATLGAFPHDGADWWVLPSPDTLQAAYRYRFQGYRSVDPADRHTIEAELYAGRPIAIALPIHDTLYNHFGDDTPVPADGGAFHFWHSMTVVGYNTSGIRILNSWGPGYGSDGFATLTWSFLARSGAGLVVAAPRQWSRPVKRTRWNRYVPGTV